MPDPRVAITIDAGSFEHGLRQVDYLGKRSRQLEFFIRHGATSNMLTKLFRISSADVTLKRRLFTGTASSLRRPSMPPHAVREQIQKRWFEIRKGKEREPERAEDYEELHAGLPDADLRHPLRRRPRVRRVGNKGVRVVHSSRARAEAPADSNERL